MNDKHLGRHSAVGGQSTVDLGRPDDFSFDFSRLLSGKHISSFTLKFLLDSFRYVQLLRSHKFPIQQSHLVTKRVSWQSIMNLSASLIRSFIVMIALQTICCDSKAF